MDIHRRILGIIYLVLGLIELFSLILGTLIFSIVFITDPDEIREFFELPALFRMVLGATIICVVLLISLPSIIIGSGLLYRKSWAEKAVLVLGCVYLFFPMVGTLLGIYTIIIEFVRQEHVKKESELNTA